MTPESSASLEPCPRCGAEAERVASPCAPVVCVVACRACGRLTDLVRGVTSLCAQGSHGRCPDEVFERGVSVICECFCHDTPVDERQAATPEIERMLLREFLEGTR